jgi:hypothetical protein
MHAREIKVSRRRQRRECRPGIGRQRQSPPAASAHASSPGKWRRRNHQSIIGAIQNQRERIALPAAHRNLKSGNNR